MTTLLEAADRRRLLPSAWRPLATLTWLVSLVVMLVLSWHLHRTGTGTRIDARLDGPVVFRLRGHRHLLSLFVAFGEPLYVAVGSMAMAGLAAGRRWWRGALLGLLGAPLAGALTELVLKPAVGVPGTGGKGLTFPSGHTAGAFGLAVTACVLLLPTSEHHPFPALLRVLLGTAALLVACGTGVALVALRYHRATDVVGGVATVALVVLTLAAVLDLSAERRR